MLPPNTDDLTFWTDPVTRPSRWALNAASAVLGFSLCAAVLTLAGVL